MERLNEDCLAMVFDFLVKSEKGLLKRQELIFSLCRVCSRWENVIRSQPSRFIECAAINEENHTKLPLERIKRAIVVRGTPLPVVRRVILRFTDALNYLELTDVWPRLDVVRHLRSIQLSSLYLRGKYLLKWEIFWKENPNLKNLKVQRTDISFPSNMFLNNLPTNLRIFVGHAVNSDCLIDCTALQSLTLRNLSFTKLDLSNLHFPNLKKFELCYERADNFNEFIKSHSRTLKKLIAMDSDVRNVGRVQFFELEYLNVRSLQRSEDFNNFPNLKYIALRNVSGAAFPTEALDLEHLCLPFDGPKDIEHLMKLKSLFVRRNFGLLETATAYLKTLHVQVSYKDVLDLEKFVSLEELVIERNPKYEYSDDLLDTYAFVIFPRRVKRVVVNAYFNFSRSLMQVEELFVKSECNYEFVRYCFPTLRIFRFECPEPNLDLYLWNRVFVRRLPLLYAMYVPIGCESLERVVRRCCETLQIFKAERMV